MSEISRSVLLANWIACYSPLEGCDGVLQAAPYVELAHWLSADAIAGRRSAADRPPLRAGRGALARDIVEERSIAAAATSAISDLSEHIDSAVRTRHGSMAQ